jgi:quercetin dioxygenase-like cupin family protein
MPQIIQAPTRIQAHGHPPKMIEEFIGRANSETTAVSIARMVSPAGWKEPGQTPEFDEFTVVLRGQLDVETRESSHQLTAGQAVIITRGEWVRYSTPSPDGAEYIAVCLPAFSPQAVHRDREESHRFTAEMQQNA